jgi:hypothetical protein
VLGQVLPNGSKSKNNNGYQEEREWQSIREMVPNVTKQMAFIVSLENKNILSTFL